MTQSTLHRRQLDFQSWPELLADIDHLRQSRYDRVGNWDLSQTLEHIGEGIRTAMRGTPHQGAWIVRRVVGPLILKRILSQRRMRAGIKVPEWWLPGPSHDESAAVDQFRSEATAFQGMTTTPFPHPYFGPLSKQQWNDLVLVHAAHHLSFLIPRSTEICGACCACRSSSSPRSQAPAWERTFPKLRFASSESLVHRPEVNGSHNGEFGGPKPVISPVRYKWSHH